MLTKNALPQPVTARRQAIRAYGIGNPTLDKYKELWHPNYLKPLLAGAYHTLAATPTIPDRLKPLSAGAYHTIKDNKLVPITAAPQGQAVGSSEVGGSGGGSTGVSSESTPQKSDRVEQQLVKMQAWLVSNDPILIAEAQQFFAAQAQQESVSLVSTNVVAPEPPEGGSSKEDLMSGGFGRSQPQRRSGKTALQEIRQLSVVPQPPVQEPDVDLAMQAEVEAFFAQYQQEHPEALALAWSAGVYNPLGGREALHARFLSPEEEDWLGLARMVGWLSVEDELDAIYFTVPPPAFALEQADWYVRSDLTTFLEEPLLLREAVQQYPIPEASIRGAIDQRVQLLGWSLEQRTRFVLELFEQPEASLSQADWELLLFELQSVD